METKAQDKDNETQVILLSHWCSDRDIAEAAWASTGRDGEDRPMTDVERVVSKQIIPFDHVTPLEAVWMKFYLHIPIFVERQLDKTRMSIQKQDMTLEYQNGEFGRLGITQNELSLRYRTMRNTWYKLPEDIIRILSAIPHVEGTSRTGEMIMENYETMLRSCVFEYDRTIEFLLAAEKAGHITNGQYKRVREVYRGILGTSFFTDMQLTLNLNALKTMADKRLEKGHPQPETQWTVSLMIQEALKQEVAPLALKGLVEKGNWEVLTSAP